MEKFKYLVNTKYIMIEIQEILNIAKEIYSRLGSGHTEKIYQNAFEYELRTMGVDYESQVIIPIYYKSNFVGFGIADIIIQKNIIIELKAIGKLGFPEVIQLQSYLKSTLCDIGILINFPQPSRRTNTVSDIEYEVIQRES